MTLKVLALDIEGGYGGSSRSLFESIAHLPADAADVAVWCRRAGPIQEKYAAIGVSTLVAPDMPHVSALPRPSRNLLALARFWTPWRRSRHFREKLRRAADDADVVHFNHEGLFLLARWLKRRTKTPLVMHIRTHLPVNIFSRRQYRTIAATMDGLVFITENEATRTARLVGRPVEGTVIFNIAPSPNSVVPHPATAGDPRFKVAVLSNYSWGRGLDRMVDVASALASRGRADIVFVVAGDMRLRGRLPGVLGELSRQGGSLEDYARRRGVHDQFIFLGHVANPEAVLAGSHILAKPTREANPWGRDIIEALGAGKPVISVGSYDRFVETGVTGVLTRDFDAESWAAEIEALADDPARTDRLGRAAAARVADLCDGPARARDLLDVWRKVAA